MWKSLRRTLNDANQGPDLHSVHQKQQNYGNRFGLSPPVRGPICPGCQEYPVALIELRSTMALRVQGGWGELLLDLQVIQVTCYMLHPRINFIGRTLTLPVCLYSVECNIVPFGCLFWPSTCKSRWSRGTLKLSEIRILVIILDKILLMVLVALLLPELLELQAETLK